MAARVGAELVGAPGHRLKRQPGRPAGARDDGIAGAGAASRRRPPCVRPPRPAPLDQRNVDRSSRSGAGVPDHQRPVELAHRARARKAAARRAAAPGSRASRSAPLVSLSRRVHQARGAGRAPKRSASSMASRWREDAAAALHREDRAACRSPAARRRDRGTRRRRSPAASASNAGAGRGSRGRLAQRRPPEPFGRHAGACRRGTAGAVDPDLAAAQQLLQTARAAGRGKCRRNQRSSRIPASSAATGTVRTLTARPPRARPQRAGARNSRQRSRRWRISRSKPASPGRYSEGRSMPSGK